MKQYFLATWSRPQCIAGLQESATKLKGYTVRRELKRVFPVGRRTFPRRGFWFSSWLTTEFSKFLMAVLHVHLTFGVGVDGADVLATRFQRAASLPWTSEYSSSWLVLMMRRLSLLGVDNSPLSTQLGHAYFSNQASSPCSILRFTHHPCSVPAVYI